MLHPGSNTLIARTVNPFGVYDPDSIGVIVNLVLPGTPITIKESMAEPATHADQVATANFGAASKLAVLPAPSYSVLADGSPLLSIQLTASGGSAPYNFILGRWD